MTYPDAPVNVVENLSARTASTLGISWQIGVNNNGASVSQYVVSMATGSGAFVVLYSGLPTFLTTVTASGLTFGTTYKLVVQSGNAFGLSAYSAQLDLLCATYPLAPISPTTVNLNSNVIVSWTAPSTKGIPITSYSVYFRKSDLTFGLLTSSCDGSNSAIMTARSCTVPLSSLTAAPFNLVLGNSVTV